MQISIDQCYAKERFWQEYEYIKMWQEYIIHRGPSFQQVKTTLYMYNIWDFIFYF